MTEKWDSETMLCKTYGNKIKFMDVEKRVLSLAEDILVNRGLDTRGRII